MYSSSSYRAENCHSKDIHGWFLVELGYIYWHGKIIFCRTIAAIHCFGGKLRGLMKTSVRTPCIYTYQSTHVAVGVGSVSVEDSDSSLVLSVGLCKTRWCFRSWRETPGFCYLYLGFIFVHTAPHRRSTKYPRRCVCVSAQFWCAAFLINAQGLGASWRAWSGHGSLAHNS